MRTFSAALTLSALALLTGTVAAGDDWYDDFDVAAEVAKKEGKDLLVDFTGSDWCIWCVRLDKEVFAHEEFLTAAKEQYVLVALDFPNTEEVQAQVPNPERNAELKGKYGVKGFPTVLLMNADGEAFAQAGYRPDGPEPYLEHMMEIRAPGLEELAKHKKFIEAFEAAEGDAQVAAWEKATVRMEELEEGSLFAVLFVPVVKWAFEADADNAKGFKLRAVEALMAVGHADDAVLQAAREVDPKNEKGLLEQSVQAQFQSVNDDVTAQAALEALDVLHPLGFKDSELGFDLLYTAAHWAAGPLQDPERAKKYAAAAKAIGTEDAEPLERLDKILNG